MPVAPKIPIGSLVCIGCLGFYNIVPLHRASGTPALPKQPEFFRIRKSHSSIDKTITTVWVTETLMGISADRAFGWRSASAPRYRSSPRRLQPLRLYFRGD